jgi:hypothetical protein
LIKTSGAHHTKISKPKTRTLPAMLRRFVALLIVSMLCSPVRAQNADLLPKYGRPGIDDTANAAEQAFLTGMDKQYQGDRRKASQGLAARGWQALRQGKSDEAMRSFNQAWLLDNANGNALWGMAQIQANRGQAPDALKLFGEANRLIGFDPDFAVDYARALSLAGVKLGDKKLLNEAFKRFAQIQERSPQHTLNLQNWAIAFFYTGQYAAAWEKIKAAQATPRGAEVDKKFVADLQGKMPRPYTGAAACIVRCRFSSMSATMASRSNSARQPQSACADESSIERGQLSAICWRKSGAYSITKPGICLRIAAAISSGVKLTADRL